MVNVSVQITNKLFVSNHLKINILIWVHLLDPLEIFLILILIFLELLLWPSNLTSTFRLKDGSPSTSLKVRSQESFHYLWSPILRLEAAFSPHVSLCCVLSCKYLLLQKYSSTNPLFSMGGLHTNSLMVSGLVQSTSPGSWSRDLHMLISNQNPNKCTLSHITHSVKTHF